CPLRRSIFISTLLASCESRHEALSQTNRAVRTRRSARRDPTGSNKPDSDSASRHSGETRGKNSFGKMLLPTGIRTASEFRLLKLSQYRRAEEADCCVRKPVQHDVIQHLIASERILGISMAIGPRPEFFENPGSLPGR